MYWVPHFGGACYSPNVLLRCGGCAWQGAAAVDAHCPAGCSSSRNAWRWREPYAAAATLAVRSWPGTAERFRYLLLVAAALQIGFPSSHTPAALPSVHIFSGGVTFTASFTLPDGTPLGGEMAPWTGSNAPTVHIVVRFFGNANSRSLSLLAHRARCGEPWALSVSATTCTVLTSLCVKLLSLHPAHSLRFLENLSPCAGQPGARGQCERPLQQQAAPGAAHVTAGACGGHSAPQRFPPRSGFPPYCLDPLFYP